MTNVKTIDLTKVPSDPWRCREYLLTKFLPAVLARSTEYICHQHKPRERLEASRDFVTHDLTNAPLATKDVLARMWFFPWIEAQHELSVALNQALLGFHRASYDHQRRALELILVGSLFVSERATEAEVERWMESDDKTPMFARTLTRLAGVGRYAKLDAETGWRKRIQEFYGRLSDISHVRGELRGFRSIQPSHCNFGGVPVPEYSAEALEKALDSFVITVGYIAMLVALSNPILVFGLPITEKCGLNGPISGFFEESQAERLRTLIPDRHRDALVALAEADPDVESSKRYFCSLPDLTVEQVKAQAEVFRRHFGGDDDRNWTHRDRVQSVESTTVTAEGVRARRSS